MQRWIGAAGWGAPCCCWVPTAGAGFGLSSCLPPGCMEDGQSPWRSEALNEKQDLGKEGVAGEGPGRAVPGASERSRYIKYWDGFSFLARLASDGSPESWKCDVRTFPSMMQLQWCNDCPFSSKNISAIVNLISGCVHLYSYQLSYVVLYVIIFWDPVFDVWTPPLSLYTCWFSWSGDYV
jgi:hypothetical protein